MIDAPTQEFMSILKRDGVTGSPCDEWQVTDLEQELHLELPAAYKAYLLLACQGFEPFEGSHYAVEDDLAELQRAGQRILRREGNKLRTDAFAFLVHQGYAVQFFLINDGADPAVFECVENWPPVKQLAAHFSEFLSQKVREWDELRSQRAPGI